MVSSVLVGVGKVIMNYHITLQGKNEYTTISFSRRSAQFDQLVLKLKLSHYMPGLVSGGRVAVVYVCLSSSV